MESSDSSAVTYSALADGYCRAGRLDDARRVVDGLPVPPSAYAYNPLMHALCVRGQVRDALVLLDGMLCRGCAPDVVTYNILLEAACKGRGYRQAMELIDLMRVEGCTPTNVTYNVIMDGMCREGDVDGARELLNSLPSHGCKANTVNYNTVLKGLRSAGRWQRPILRRTRCSELLRGAIVRFVREHGDPPAVWTPSWTLSPPSGLACVPPQCHDPRLCRRGPPMQHTIVVNEGHAAEY